MYESTRRVMFNSYLLSTICWMTPRTSSVLQYKLNNPTQYVKFHPVYLPIRFVYRTPCYVVNYTQSCLVNLPYEVSSNQTRKAFVLKNGPRQKGVPFYFFFASNKPIWMLFSLHSVYGTKAFANYCTLWRYSPGVITPPLS